jgi:hypothetical protein
MATEPPQRFSRGLCSMLLHHVQDDRERDDGDDDDKACDLADESRYGSRDEQIATSGSVKRFAIFMTMRLRGASVIVLGPNWTSRLAASASVKPEAPLPTRS